MHRPGERIYRIVNGGPAPRRIAGQDARKKIDRELHGLALAVREGNRVPQQHADWHYDLRQKRNRVYGGLLRFVDVSVASGTPREVLLNIPRLIEAYINDLYDDDRKTAA